MKQRPRIYYTEADTPLLWAIICHPVPNIA